MPRLLVLLVFALAVLALVWSAVAALSAWMDASIPTAEKLLAYVDGRPLEKHPRGDVVESLARP